MKELTITASLLLAGLLFSGAAAADPLRVDQRQANQAQRIANGVQSGQLTGYEAHQLIHQQAHIRKTERRFRSDGVLTRGEKIRLEHKQDVASHNIYRQKHDRQRRG
ncbi:MAG: hypothetical protein QNJ40_03255 [Xanthomonadales bacterium]|nr:hypothetical protein [Xanthomonadales bacterium]